MKFKPVVFLLIFCLLLCLWFSVFLKERLWDLGLQPQHFIYQFNWQEINFFKPKPTLAPQKYHQHWVQVLEGSAKWGRPEVQTELAEILSPALTSDLHFLPDAMHQLSPATIIPVVMATTPDAANWQKKIITLSKP